ncbi:MFS general substrate transporter [Dothidotthia symphoricarpi CBS 119687]|uniref:MFS general substrate transporter n=1 Tax=Dothidotthia symphoricarpi CBS 119687 TaxID=1392245 RepID=A0A6A5ZY94_9PLEO|nr:MFS general substrate transporter [Dothidotthia symphoricarpi CBS 119687]KAF2124722.1 MFS general substrate transporter [Dothidotthia symphoricarpi CBS 119687]
MESADADLERSYSRERQRLGADGQKIVTSPVAVVHSVSSESRRGRSGEENTHAAQFESLGKDGDSNSDLGREDDNEKIVTESPASVSRTGSPTGVPSPTDGIPPKRRTIRFEDGDPENPNNWPRKKKIYAIFVAIISVINSTMTSGLAAGAAGPISRHFNETNEYKLILPTSIYLVGYVCGPMVWGPLSESYGRKGTMIYSYALFTVFSIASAVSPNFSALVVFRLFAGIGGSCAISVVGGICADVYHNPISRGRSMAIFMAATTFGPILGPPVSGFISTVSWSWAFWIGAIFAGVSSPLILLFPETYGPAILKRRAQRLRKETGDESIVAPIELEKTDLNHIVTVVLTRPLRMICFEPLVLFTCLYLSYAYAIFYIYFQSYPVIFTGIYHFNAGEQGLAFLPIGLGALISAGIYLTWDAILGRAQKAHKPWAKNEEMRRLPLACIAGPFFVISSFWLGWTARENIHWIVPVLAGVLFGMGYLCLFMALLNYLVDAYEIFAASAMAAASLSRSSFGAVLPFAARPMYRALGVAWATSLLGFFSLALCVVPFAFFRWGGKMREKSKFCQHLRAKKMEEKAERDAEREAEGRSSGGLQGMVQADGGKEQV